MGAGRADPIGGASGGCAQAPDRERSHAASRGTRRGGVRWRRWALGAGIALVALVALVAIASVFVDEPLRRQAEQQVNAALDGYTVTIGALDLQLLGFALVLKDLTVVQDSHPDPPVLYLPRWRTSVQWRALLSGALVADTAFDGPQIFLTQPQARAESSDRKPADERGWQDAVQAVYPLKIVDVFPSELQSADHAREV